MKLIIGNKYFFSFLFISVCTLTAADAFSQMVQRVASGSQASIAGSTARSSMNGKRGTANSTSLNGNIEKKYDLDWLAESYSVLQKSLS
ncbi:hypothetical protein OAO01_00065 [Oligoflexia bacterium]|nr:hypothetical protein [Oligoflexia bacterium]